MTFYASASTTRADRERFFAGSTARRVAAIEEAWLAVLRATALVRYAFAADGFELTDANAGYWVSRRPVEPIRVEPVGAIEAALARAGVELRVLPSLWDLRDAVVASSLGFSIIRWGNAGPRS